MRNDLNRALSVGGNDVDFEMVEDLETRLRRLKMRSWRRGMKEMDLILGGFADSVLASLTLEELDAHEAMMAQNDQDLYLWATNAAPTPDQFLSAISKVKQYLASNSFES